MATSNARLWIADAIALALFWAAVIALIVSK